MTKMSDLVRKRDWTATALGSFEEWSDTLVSHVHLVLSAPHPALLIWGNERNVFLNDAALETLEIEHPAALGRSYGAVFDGVWPLVQTDMEHCFQTGASTVRENVLMPFLKSGKMEEAYWTYCLMPLYEKGRIGGVHYAFRNTTDEVVSARQRDTVANHLRRALDDLSVSNEKLARVAGTDALTGLANRRSFDERYEEVWRTSCVESSSLALILIDLDHFKRVNDNYGHLYGDQALRRVAHLLSETLRKGEDFAARFGGEEFVIVLPSTDVLSACNVAERVRTVVEAAGLPPLGRRISPPAFGATVSCGVAALKPHAHLDSRRLVEAADQALYRAKRQGRNQVCFDEVTKP